MSLFPFGANVLRSPSDSDGPYRELSAPQGRPDTIIILGHTDRSGTWSRVIEYGKADFGEDVSQPMPDLPSTNRYLVVCNYTRQSAGDDTSKR